MTLFYISAVDLSKRLPKGERFSGGPGFLGVFITEAPTLERAAQCLDLLLPDERGCVEIASWELPSGAYDPEWCDRLLSFQEYQDLPDPKRKPGH